MAVGNVVGSNIFNILGILGVTALIHPLPSAGIGWIDLAMMVATALLVLPFFLTGARVGRREGAFLLLIFAGYTLWLLGPAAR